ncbi:reverse transcriptase domain-containing protein [Tanacetum coccineum]
MAYDTVPDALDEYLQMSATTADDNLQSPIFNYLKSEKAPEVPFVATEVTYKRGYYLTDGIYPEWERAISLRLYPYEQHRDDDPVLTNEETGTKEKLLKEPTLNHALIKFEAYLPSLSAPCKFASTLAPSAPPPLVFVKENPELLEALVEEYYKRSSGNPLKRLPSYPFDTKKVGAKPGLQEIRRTSSKIEECPDVRRDWKVIVEVVGRNQSQESDYTPHLLTGRSICPRHGLRRRSLLLTKRGKSGELMCPEVILFEARVKN